jgi:hypothetical protein
MGCPLRTQLGLDPFVPFGRAGLTPGAVSFEYLSCSHPCGAEARVLHKAHRVNEICRSEHLATNPSELLNEIE